jgi:uncharacterized membrane protein
MDTWTAKDWIELIAALTAAVTAIIAAWRGNAAAQKIDRHEENAQDRAAGAAPRHPTL